jgi:copper(I)-binding protein
MLSRRLYLLVLALLAAVPALAAEPPIRVEHGWARATPDNATIGAAYLTIDSSVDDRLVSAASPVADDVQLQENLVEDGVTSMRRVTGIDVHAGQRLVLEPEGLHFRLIGLKQKLHPGQSFALTVTFAKAGAVETQIAVEPIGSLVHDHNG